MRMRLIAQTLLDSQYLIYNGYVRDREGEGGGEMCKPPAIRIRATLIFWKNGTYSQHPCFRKDSRPANRLHFVGSLQKRGS